MSQNIMTEAVFAARCIGMGALIAVAYDLLRICRRCVKHSRFLVSLEDFLFWVICAIFIFLVLYQENNGILRWYCIGGALIGMLLYGKIVSPYFVFVMSTLCKKTIHLVGKGISILTWPIRMLFRGIRKNVKKLCKFFTKRKKAENK